MPPVVANRLEAAAQQAAASEAADVSHVVGYGERERAHATRAAGTPDLAATPVDEHRDALVRATVAHGDADHEAVREASSAAWLRPSRP